MRGSQDENEEYEERAAILEYDAGMDRASAEYHAARIIRERNYRNQRNATARGEDRAGEGKENGRKKAEGKSSKKACKERQVLR